MAERNDDQLEQYRHGNRDIHSVEPEDDDPVQDAEDLAVARGALAEPGENVSWEELKSELGLDNEEQPQ